MFFLRQINHLSVWGMLLFCIFCPFISSHAEVRSYVSDSFLSDRMEQADLEYESDFLSNDSRASSRNDFRFPSSSSFSSRSISQNVRNRFAVSNVADVSSLSSLRNWILASSNSEFSDRHTLLNVNDPVFFYLEENRRLSFQLDFFLKVTCDPRVYVSRVHSFANSSGLENASSSSSDSDNMLSFFADCFSAVLRRGFSDSFSVPADRIADRFDSRLRIAPFRPSIFVSEDPDLVLTLHKFHRYLVLLFHFPPNFSKGLNPLC